MFFAKDIKSVYPSDKVLYSNGKLIVLKFFPMKKIKQVIVDNDKKQIIEYFFILLGFDFLVYIITF